MSYKITAIGEVLWDVFPNERHLGGAPFNFACHSKSLGAESFIVSAVGDDELGKEIIAEVNKKRVNDDYLQVNEFETGQVSVSLDEEGKPEYEIKKNSAWDNLKSGEAIDLAQKTDVVCWGTLASRTDKSYIAIKEFLQNTKNDCLKVFDINLRQDYYSRELIEEFLNFADILKLNDEELPVLVDFFGFSPNIKEALREAKEKFGLKLIALTRGGKGSLLYDGKIYSEHGGFFVKCQDTVGAGDAFTAGMVMAYLAGQDLEKINEKANKIASFVCTRPGATPEIDEDLKTFG